ncbi:hypothetical protein [Polyangium sp. 15x6]|uniref:hypothetical protein n=1 Tax=Polyangium sp. 15x6 TaxID=3042687 RepID=UPI00249CB09F|nr:hypothetical protein [Polyangium sp. 15x6]MDI3284687.1 hypothetical protein [Polyangium sp. 15x6]
MSPEEIREYAGKLDKMVQEAVNFQQKILTDTDDIAELYLALERIKKAPDPDVSSKWTAFWRTWGKSAIVPLKQFVDAENNKQNEQNKRNEQKLENQQKMAKGLEWKKEQDAAKKKERERLAQKHKQEKAALAKAHRRHFSNPDVLKSINEKLKSVVNEKPNEKPTLCTAVVVVEGTEPTMAFGTSSVGNHSPFQAFYRDKDGIIRCTKAAEVHAKVLEPLRATLAGIQKVEDWEVYVCAEVDAAVQLLLRGKRLEQIKTYATDFDLNYKERCAHCTQWATEF